MIEFLKKHANTIVITAIALLILYWEFTSVPSWKRFQPSSITNPFFVAVGKWGIRFLLLSLAMSPIYAFTGWRYPLKLRKPLGLSAFLFVSIHAGLYLFAKADFTGNVTLLQRLTQPWFVILGFAAFIILSLMAITSFKATTKIMGKYWKPLHRLVYGAAILLMLHAMVAATYGKRPFMGGEESFAELKIYMVLMILLLVLRIPFIKHRLQALIPFAPKGRKPKVKRSLITS